MLIDSLYLIFYIYKNFTYNNSVCIVLDIVCMKLLYVAESPYCIIVYICIARYFCFLFDLLYMY